MKIQQDGEWNKPKFIEEQSEKEQLECPKHGAYMASVKILNFLDGRKMYTACPECDKEIAEEEKRRAEVRKQAEADIAKRRVEASWRDMNIGEKYLNAAFDTFITDTPELEKHLRTARFFAEKPEGNLVMIGGHGNGKTHLAASILKRTGGVLYKAYEIGMLIRCTYEGIGSEGALLDKLCTTPLLVIDKLEKLKESEAKQHWFSYVAGKRYDNLKPMVLIGNCHLADDCTAREKPCPKCLEYHLTPDILSRIRENGIIIKFTGQDYRSRLSAEYLARKRAEIRKAEL